MKKIRLYIIAVIIIILNFSGSVLLQAQIIDIDGNTYNAIVIGNQTWMRENLKVTHFRDGTAITNITINATWTSATSAGYCWYNNNDANKNIYGALYNWFTISAGNLCPTGYHVPSNDEWTTLVTFLGGVDVAGGKLKEAGITHWLTPNTGATNESGFTALPGGNRQSSDGTFSSIGGGGIWWSSTLFSSNAYYWGLIYNDRIIGNYTANQRFGMSVRCLRDMRPTLTTSSVNSITRTSAQSGGNITYDGGAAVTARGICWNTSPNPTTLYSHTNNGTGIGSFTSNMSGLAPNTTYYVRAYATNSVGTAYGEETSFTTYNSDAISDLDGNFYNVVIIGSQTWIVQNLKTTKYNDGTSVPNVTDMASWPGLTSAAYCWYNNDAATYKDTYGALYNWYAVDAASNGGKNLCPTGWHVPSNAEWSTLDAYLGGGTVAGGKMKEAGLAHWASPNTGADNSSGFTALPAGVTFLGGFHNLGSYDYMWSTTTTIAGYAACRDQAYNSAESFAYQHPKENGFSVRCLMNAPPTLTTTSITSITQTTAHSGGNISTDGGVPVSARGICWSTSPNPTISDNHTTDGAGTGTFSSSLSGLTPNTPYYVRAYATNSIGTGYGNEVSFTSLTCPPITATIGGTTTVCKDATPPSISFTGASGTAPYTFTYKINGGGNKTITTTTGNSVSITAPTEVAGAFTYALVSVYDAIGSACIQTQSGSAIVTVNPLPTATINGTTTVCKDGTSPNITFTGASGTAPYTFTYKINGGSNLIVTTTAGNSVSITAPTGTAGTYTYALVSVNDANACSQTQSGNATITVTPDNTITLTSAGSTTSQTVCISTAITTITYTTTGATGVNITNMPAGVTGALAENVVTISGTPTASGPFNYTVTLTGGCGAVTATGTITVTAANTAGAPSSAPTLCINTALTNITHATTGATGIGAAVGLPAGVNAVWAADVITIDGTPTASGVFNYNIPLTGGCAIVIATGTITVNPLPAAPVTSVTQPTCALATGTITVTVQNSGETYSFDNGSTFQASNIKSGLVAGSYNVIIKSIGGCNSVAKSTTVNPQPLTPIVPNQAASISSGATFTVTPTGGTIPTGTTYTWGIPTYTGGVTGGTAQAIPQVNISGTLTIPSGVGTAIYTVTPTSGTCVGATFSVTVTVTSTCVQVTIGTQPSNKLMCATSGNASFTVVASGSAPFTYQWQYYNGSLWATVVNGTPSGASYTNPATATLSVTGITTAGSYQYRCYITNCSGGNSATSSSATLTVNALPTATASNNGPIRIGSPLILTGGPAEMTSYAWTGPNSFTSSAQSPTVSASATTEMAGVYTLIVTNSNGCQSTAITTVTFNPFIVTNVNDNGTGSLRNAIDNANLTFGVKEVITFDIPGYGPFTIRPATPLPAITDPVIIDGYSQAGASATSPVLLIEIDGTNAGEGSNGLTISGGGSTVRGLILNRFAGAGIQIGGSGANSILGNFIGVDFSGTLPEGNSGDGIQINGSSNNKIGGTNPGEGNVISGNNGAGISIQSNGASGNTISSNSIYSNGGIGIDLGGNGVTSNDTGDPDTGPNNLQNFPVLTSVSFSTGSVTISVSLNSGASKTCNLQFFASKLADNSGNGEGQTYLGSKTLTTGSTGDASFTQDFAIKSSWGTVITATATDPLGNTSEFSKSIGGFQNQTVVQWPLLYTLNKDGVPNITDGADLDAVRASFQTWSAISTANIQFTEAGATTSNRYANANDGVNLVSFVDDQFPFSYGVLAVAAKTLRIDPTTQAASIIDADIVVNPDFVNDIKYNLGVGYNNKNAGYFDIQSVITHEIGHILGLLHTGVVGSTMFFTLNSGIKVRTLEQDDKSWASYGYPKQPLYNSTFGSISGNIKYGYGGQPLAGALVYAISTSRQDSVHGYSDALGNYLIPGLLPGSYNVYIEPLDGDVNGYNLRPANISSYTYSNTVYTDYPGEFYNNPDLANESDDSKSAVTVNAGSLTSGIDLITNTDNIPPTVVSVSPTDVSASLINILSNFSIKFSEAIDETSLTTGTCYLIAGSTTIGGTYTNLGNNVVLFDPASILEYSTGYTLHITTGVKDLRDNSLQSEFTQSFTTISEDTDPPKLNEVIPANLATGVFVSEKIRVFFSEPMNKASVENGFTLTWTNGSIKIVGGSFSWENDNTSFTFTPSGSMRENTVYTIKLLNTITDLSGNHIANNESRTFTTVAQAQVTIQYLGPGNGNTGVPVTTPVVVDFSEPINTYTVTLATFKLLLGNTSTTIPGSFEFLNENSRVVFTPDANLNFNQLYTIQLTSGIQDLSPTSSNLVASTTTFTTAARITVPDILYLEPSSGVVGNVVTITGTGFDPNPVKNKITFNGINAPVKGATLTSLTTEVPMGSLSGPVEVTVNGTVSGNTMYFYIIPQSLDPCSDIIGNKSTGSGSSHDADITEAISVGGVLTTYAYVTNPEQGTVSVVNLTTLGTPAQIPVGKTPMKIDINPQGTRAYVTNFNSHNVSVIDLVTTSANYNKVIKTITVGIEPYGVAVTPDGKRVYVANYYSGNLSVIDEDPRSGGFDHVVANVSTGSSSGNVAVTADAGMVLVTGNFGLKIVNSNPADKEYNSVIANVNTGSKANDVTATADAGLAIVSTEDGHLMLIDLHPENGDYSEAVIANVSTGTKGSGADASGDNLFVYLTDTEHDQILVYQIGIGGSGNPNSSGVANLTLIPHNKILLGPGGGKAPIALAISADASRLYVIDTKVGTSDRQITTIAICCGPISPQKAIGDLIITIQNMINNGNITKLRGYALIVTLNSALRNIYANRPKLTLLDLNAFKALVKTYIKNKQISAAQGNALISSINAIIAQLNGAKSALEETYLTDNEQSNRDLVPESKLGVIYPNPFRQSVTIDYEIAENKENINKVLIKVYDINGQLVSTLVDKMMESGCYSTTWKGNYDQGNAAPYGTYFLLFRTGTVEEVRKIMLIKPH